MLGSKEEDAGQGGGLDVGLPPRQVLRLLVGSTSKAPNASLSPQAGESTPGQVGECFPSPCMCGRVSHCQHVRGSPAWDSCPDQGDGLGWKGYHLLRGGSLQS